MAKYEIKYKSIIASEDKMMADLEEILDENTVCGSLKHKFKIAVSEAFTNALLHGNKLEEDKIIILIININDSVLSADIIDQGQEGLEKIRNKKPATLISESGRGIDLIAHFAAKFDYEEISTGGLKVSIKFNRIERKTII